MADGTPTPAPTNPTQNYRPQAFAYGAVAAHVYDNKPFFTYWDVPRMLRDPWVQFVMKVWASPFRDVQPKVTSADPKVAAFVTATVNRFWAKDRPRLLRRYFKYGFAPGGLEYRVKGGKWVLNRVRPVEPPDARAREFVRSGRLAGFETPSTGPVYAPYAMWFAGMGEAGPHYDRPPLAGMFDPYLECNTRGGAVHLRQMYGRKVAIEPAQLKHPSGQTTSKEANGQDYTRDNQEIALTTLEWYEAAANVTLPSDVDEHGKPKWELIPSKAGPSNPFILDYPEKLKAAMAEGAGVPYEAIVAAETGSGYSGRKVPYYAWLGMTDELAGVLYDDFDRCCLRHLVRINFGRKADYEVEPQSLVEKARQDEKGGGGGPQPAGATPPPPGGQGGPLGVPYHGPQGGEGVKDPITGHVTYKPPGGYQMSAAVPPPAPPEVVRRVRQKVGPSELSRRRAHTLAALAMVALQQEAHDEGNPHAYQEHLDSLAALCHDPERLLHIAKGGHPDAFPAVHPRPGGPAVQSFQMAWENRGPTGRTSRGGQPVVRWYNPDLKAYRYQVSEPGAAAEARQRAVASGERGRYLARMVTSYTATPEHMEELATHLPAMRREDLSKVRAMLMASFKNGKTRDAMAKALVDHVRGVQQGLVEELANPPAKPQWDTSDKPDREFKAKRPDRPQPNTTYVVNPHDLHADPDRFQYKAGGDAAGATWGAEQRGAFDPHKAGELLVWRDPADGRDYVVDGHNRHAWAKKDNAAGVKVRYVQADTAEHARALGVLANVLGGRGDPADAARYAAAAGAKPAPKAEPAAEAPTEAAGPSLASAPAEKEPEAPAAKPAPIDLADPAQLAAAAHDAARSLPDPFGHRADDPDHPTAHAVGGRHKAFVDEVYDKLKGDGRLPEGTTLDAFKAAAFDAMQAGQLEMSRSDMGVSGYGRRDHTTADRTTILHPMNGYEFHTINVPTGPQTQKEAEGDQAAAAGAEPAAENPPPATPEPPKEKSDAASAPAAVPGRSDPLDITPDTVEAVWKHNRDGIVAADPKISPAQAGAVAAARILNGYDRRADEFASDTDRRVRRGEQISDADDAKYGNLPDARRSLYEKLTALSGYRPGAGAEGHPGSAEDIEFPGVTVTSADRLKRALAHLDPAKAKAAAAAVKAHTDDHETRVHAAELEVAKAKEALRVAGGRQPEKRNAQKALAAAQKKQAALELARNDYYRLPATRKAELEGVAVDESQPDFVRVAAANEAAGRPRAADLTGMVKDHLAKHGHDPRIADAVANEVSQSPMRAARKLKDVIDGETTRRKMYDERKEAREFVATLNMMPHDAAEAEREAGDLYQGDIGRFKEKWQGLADRNRAEQERRQKIEEEAKERREQEAAAKAKGDEYLASVRRGHPDPAAPPEAVAEAVRHALDAPMQWHPGAELPPAQTAKQMVADVVRQSAGGRWALAKTITEQGWLTDTKYAVKATPEMVAHAQAAGADRTEGRGPPIKDIVAGHKGLDPAKVVATRENGDGTPVVLVETEGGKQAVLDAWNVANVLKLYPGAEIRVNPVKGRSGPVFFLKDGEPVGLVMPFSDGGDAREEYGTDRRLTLKDVAAPGPYSAADMREVGDRVYAGPQAKGLYARVASSGSGYTITGYTDRTYPTRPQAVAAAKELLAHAHGTDADGHLIFKPVGAGATELEGDEATRKAYYDAITDRAAKGKLRKSQEIVKATDGAEHPREFLHVTDAFAVHKALPDAKGKSEGWTTVHTPTGLAAGSWNKKDDAVRHAHVLAGIPGIDWKNFRPAEMEAADPEGVKAAREKMRNATKAFEGDEYHPDMGPVPGAGKKPGPPPEAVPPLPPPALAGEVPAAAGPTDGGMPTNGPDRTPAPVDAAPPSADNPPATTPEPTDGRGEAEAPPPPAPQAQPPDGRAGDRGPDAVDGRTGRGGDRGGVGGEPNQPRRPRIVTARADHTPAHDPALVPGSVATHLNDTQKQGVALAVKAMDDHGGFVLADGPGTGKTRQILGVARHFLDRGKKVLVVAPAEVIKPDWKKGTLYGSFDDGAKATGVPLRLSGDAADFGPGTAHITTYEKMRAFADKIDPDTVILFDEAHYMKNRDSARSKVGREMAEKAHAVLYSTATPGDKPLHVGYLARAGVFGSEGATKTYERMGLQLVDQHVGRGEYRKVWRIDPKVGYAEAARRISGLFDQMTREGLMVRRELSLDGVDMGAEHAALAPEQHAELDKVYKDVLARTADDTHPAGNKAAAVMAMRLHQEPMKVPATVATVQQELAAGRSPVVFVGRVNDIGDDEDEEPRTAMGDAGHTSEGTAAALKKALIAAGVPESDIAELHGGATKTAEQKKKAMERFQANKAKVMIATIQSGGTGVNLDDTTGTRPRTAVVMTPPFSANDLGQAIGRVHRLNTASKARVRLMLSDSAIDRRNADILHDKFRTLGAIAGGESAAGAAALGADAAADHQPSTPFEWGGELRSGIGPGGRVHADTPAYHNEKIGEFGGRRTQVNGQWTTQFPSRKHFQQYQEFAEKERADRAAKAAANPAPAAKSPPRATSGTFTQLKSGDWGVRAEGYLEPGQTLTVKKRDGSTKTVTVGKVVWQGSGVTLATIR